MIETVVVIISTSILFFISKWVLKRKSKRNSFIACSLRGTLKTKKYDSKGRYTEEYIRTKLIKYLIKNIKKKLKFSRSSIKKLVMGVQW